MAATRTGAGNGWTRNYSTEANSNRVNRTWYGSNTVEAITYRHDIHGNILFGRGLGSFLVLHQDPPGTPEHVASLPLLILNDTGIVGLILFAAFVVTIFLRAWKRRRHPLVVGLSQVALVLRAFAAADGGTLDAVGPPMLELVGEALAAAFDERDAASAICRIAKPSHKPL